MSNREVMKLPLDIALTIQHSVFGTALRITDGSPKSCYRIIKCKYEQLKVVQALSIQSVETS
jgi:hypothetical protein